LEVLERVKARHGAVYMVVGDTGCCGYSNVFLTSVEPGGDCIEAGEAYGLPVYVRPPLDSTLDLEGATVDVVEAIADDSLSLETELGRRLVLRLEPRCRPSSSGEAYPRPRQSYSRSSSV